MLEQILAQQTAVQAVISQRNARPLMLSPTDITLIEFIHGALKPLAEATTLTCTESVLPSWRFSWFLLRNHLALNDTDSKVVSDIKKEQLWLTNWSSPFRMHTKENYLLVSILDTALKLWNFYHQLIDCLHLTCVTNEAFTVRTETWSTWKILPHPWPRFRHKGRLKRSHVGWRGENPNGHEGERERRVSGSLVGKGPRLHPLEGENVSHGYILLVPLQPFHWITQQH